MQQATTAQALEARWWRRSSCAFFWDVEIALPYKKKTRRFLSFSKTGAARRQALIQVQCGPGRLDKIRFTTILYAPDSFWARRTSDRDAP